MKRIYHVFDEDKCREGFLNEQGEVLASWDENDANWRGEYMDRLLKSLGVEVVYKVEPEMVKAFKKGMKKYS